MKRNFIKSMKKRIRKMRRKKRSLRQKQRNRQCVKQRKVQRRKRAVQLQHRQDSSRKGRRFREEKEEPQKRKWQILPKINGLQHSSPFLIMRWGEMVSAGCRINFIPRPSVFMTSTTSWLRMRIKMRSLKTGVTS